MKKLFKWLSLFIVAVVAGLAILVPEIVVKKLRGWSDSALQPEGKQV